jgi:TetR/AcrR family transcriptional regulator
VISAFENLPYEKRNKVLQSCIEEFAQYGYEQASTNRIVKRADISKGILFHYFGDKKTLYMYVIRHAIKILSNRIYQETDTYPGDLVEQLMAWGMKKIQLAAEEPVLFQLLFSALTTMPSDLSEELTELWGQIYIENTQKFTESIDTTQFRADIDPAKAVEFIMLSLNALTTKYTDYFRGQKSITPEIALPVFEEYKSYLDILRYGVYPQKND